MKNKILALIMCIVMVIGILPVYAFAVPMTPEISLEEFANQLKALQEQYDDNYVGEIVIEDGSECYCVDGKTVSLEEGNGELSTASVGEDGIDIPLSVLEENSAEYVSKGTSRFGKFGLTKEKQYSSNEVSVEEYAETLGYDVEINDDTAVLSQPYQTHRLIVKSKYKINPLDSVAMVEGYNDLHVVQFDDMESTVNALEYYEGQSNIEYAEPDLVLSLAEYEDYDDTDTEDYYMGINYGYHKSYGSELIGIDDYIDYLDYTQTYPEIVVAVIDTGVELTHEFLADRIIETGFNVSDSGTENSENDDQGHGTHVSGIVVDNTTNNVKIKAYKVMNGDGKGTVSTICLGIEKATADGVNVINMSVGGPGRSETMIADVQNAVAQGITVCVAAGNSFANASYYMPAGIEECITVGAIDEDSCIPLFSNFGPMVDIMAPGVAINSSYLNNTFATKSGTSMSSPFVAAASAMLLTVNPTLNSTEVLDLMLENSLIGPFYEDKYFYHVLNLYIGNIASYNRERTGKPLFSVKGGKYIGSVTVELSCPDDPDAKIYYTTNNRRASPYTDTLYTGPITLEKTRVVRAVAVVEGKMKSVQSYERYYVRCLDPESNFEIDSNGIITKYTGMNGYLKVPDTINGITVRGIGDNVFSAGKAVIKDIELPDTCVSLGNNAFYYQKYLETVDAKNIRTVGDNAFYHCDALAEYDFSNLEQAGEGAFYECDSIVEVRAEKLTTVEKKAFHGMTNVVIFDLPNVTRVEFWGMNDCRNVEKINLPKAEYLGGNAFSNNPMLAELNIPNVRELDSSGYQFSNTPNLTEVDLRKVESSIPRGAFRSSAISKVIIPKATSIEDEAFKDIPELSFVYAPKAASVNGKAFWSSGSTERDFTLFIPSATLIGSLPCADTLTMYCSELLTSVPNSGNYNLVTIAGINNLNMIAPTNSYACSWAVDNGHNYIDAYNVANNLSVNRRAYDDSLRFGFSWNEIDELNEYAEEIEYGFDYSYFGNEKYWKSADNSFYHPDSNSTSFNLVLSNIPDNMKGQLLDIRAYVNIDGMLFKSPRINTTYSATQPDETSAFETGDINGDGSITLLDYSTVKMHLSGDVDLLTGEYNDKPDDNTFDFTTGNQVFVTKAFYLADINGDGAVDAFDLFEIDKKINGAA